MHKLRHTPGDPEEALAEAVGTVVREGPVYVLGLGYVDKADDGAGVLVANTLKKTFPDHSFSEHDGVEGTVLDISERSGPGTVLFVDAGDLGAPPGTIEIVPRDHIEETEISTHRVPVALMAAILERSGKRVAIIAIQPKSLEFRAEMSEEVGRSVEAVVTALSRLMQERNG
jgi:hydrogenase maturation protease